MRGVRQKPRSPDLIGTRMSEDTIVVYLTHLYNTAPAVIPVKTGIQTSSLRKQGTIIKWNWIPVSTGNPGFRIKSGMTISKGITDTLHYVLPVCHGL